MKVLQFSGGIDSLACLELLKNERGLHVVTVSTDGSYPERDAYLKMVADRHPHIPFMTIMSDRDLKEYGHPVDVVPMRYTGLGNMIEDTPVKYQSAFECCARGFWYPMMDTMIRMGATEVFRGQRRDDLLKSPIKDGHVEGPITYRFPIYDWTRGQVAHYVKVNCPDLVPEYYSTELTSRDCWDCTAYLRDNAARIRNLPHEQRIKVSDILAEWRRDVNEETRW
jgi:3'-phosphoadenosine 5'-phosphosulfate sulfotransferase (PAPS reductase)/FAD synthetase